MFECEYSPKLTISQRQFANRPIIVQDTTGFPGALPCWPAHCNGNYYGTMNRNEKNKSKATLISISFITPYGIVCYPNNASQAKTHNEKRKIKIKKKSKRIRHRLSECYLNHVYDKVSSDDQ